MVLQGILARAALVFLRLYLGLAFLLSSWLKLDAGSPPAVSPVSALVFAELALGITLTLGVLTRLSAAGALIVSVAYLQWGGGGHDWTLSAYAAHAAIAVALLVGAAGRSMGLDALLARRWPRSPLW